MLLISLEEENSFEPEEGRIRLKRRSVKGRPKLCPKCLAQMHIIGSLSGWLLPEEYLCDNCGYHGHVAFEVISEKQDKKN
jgi:predicted RNA-binding Zn-ribbon protein involved in translation (DUF1610 family)